MAFLYFREIANFIIHGPIMQSTFVNSYRFMLIASHHLVSCATFIFQTRPIVCFKTIKVTKQGYRQDRQQRENRVLSSHIWWQIWWQNGGCFSA